MSRPLTAAEVLALLRRAHDEGYRHGYQNCEADMRDSMDAFDLSDFRPDTDPGDSFDLWLDEVAADATMSGLMHDDP